MRHFRPLLLLTASFLLTATPVLADQSFHSERLLLFLTDAGRVAGFPQLRTGQVIDIHPDGPVNFAIEEYVLNGAEPDTSYAVVLNVGDPSCPPGGPTTQFPNGASVVTDANGNGYGEVKLSLEQANALGIRHLFVGLSWTFWAGGFPTGVPAYASDCVPVHTD